MLAFIPGQQRTLLACCLLLTMPRWDGCITTSISLHVLNYVNAGHDVLNATQLKGAIDSYCGILAHRPVW